MWSVWNALRSATLRAQFVNTAAKISFQFDVPLVDPARCKIALPSNEFHQTLCSCPPFDPYLMGNQQRVILLLMDRTVDHIGRAEQLRPCASDYKENQCDTVDCPRFHFQEECTPICGCVDHSSHAYLRDLSAGTYGCHLYLARHIA